jgi:hypothetical protein
MLVAAALAITALYITGGLQTGALPTASESGTQIVVWLREHRDGVRWYVWTTTVGLPLYAFAVARLCGLLPAPHREMFLIGGAAVAITQMLQAWFWAGLALHPDRLEPATARAILDVAVFWGPMLTGATITVMAPVVLLAASGGLGLPRWLAVFGALAIVEQAIETVTIFSSSGWTQPGGAMNLQLGAALTGSWFLAFALWGGLRGDFSSQRDGDRGDPR